MMRMMGGRQRRRRGEEGKERIGLGRETGIGVGARVAAMAEEEEEEEEEEVLGVRAVPIVRRIVRGRRR
jgi:hypothetical protein